MSFFSMFSLDDRSAVVTGAGGGLGKAYAHALAAAGAQVVCADRDGDAARASASSIQALGGRATSFVVDVADESSVDALAVSVRERHGALHVLVNNAGITSLPMRTHEVKVADFDRVMGVNVRGTFLCSRALLPLMLETCAAAGGGGAGGSIVNLASFIGLVGLYPGFALSGVPYATSKAAIVGLSRQMAAEYAADGVRVNVIAPGWHGGTNLGRERRLTATSDDIERFEKHIEASVPMRRRGKAEEMDGLIVYLASDASRYVTGQVFSHDGGVTAV